MDFSALLFERLGQIDGYLYSHIKSSRLIALGRVCELDQLAFTLRNADLISVPQYDRYDEASARMRRIHNLHSDYRDLAAGRAYNDRLLPFQPLFDMCDDESQPGQPAPDMTL